MRRRGFSPYGPSKAALESETIIWSQELEGTGVTYDALLPGGATRTGMVPDSVSDGVRAKFLDTDIMVPLLLLNLLDYTRHKMQMVSEEAAKTNAKKAIEAGVKIGLGTDSSARRLLNCRRHPSGHHLEIG